MNTNTDSNTNTVQNKDEKNKEQYKAKNEVLCWSANGWFYGDQKTFEICRKEYNKYFNINKK